MDLVKAQNQIPLYASDITELLKLESVFPSDSSRSRTYFLVAQSFQRFIVDFEFGYSYIDEILVYSTDHATTTKQRSVPLVIKKLPSSDTALLQKHKASRPLEDKVQAIKEFPPKTAKRLRRFYRYGRFLQTILPECCKSTGSSPWYVGWSIDQWFYNSDLGIQVRVVEPLVTTCSPHK